MPAQAIREALQIGERLPYQNGIYPKIESDDERDEKIGEVREIYIELAEGLLAPDEVAFGCDLIRAAVISQCTQRVALVMLFPKLQKLILNFIWDFNYYVPAAKTALREFERRWPRSPQGVVERTVSLQVVLFSCDVIPGNLRPYPLHNECLYRITRASVIAFPRFLESAMELTDDVPDWTPLDHRFWVGGKNGHC